MRPVSTNDIVGRFQNDAVTVRSCRTVLVSFRTSRYVSSSSPRSKFAGQETTTVPDAGDTARSADCAPP